MSHLCRELRSGFGKWGALKGHSRHVPSEARVWWREQFVLTLYADYDRQWLTAGRGGSETTLSKVIG